MATLSKEKSFSSHSILISDMTEAKKVFDRFDANGDGKISATELANVMKALGSETSPEELDQMMEDLDTDHDGYISLEEFASFCNRKPEGDDETGSQELHEAFEMYDQDKNGLISSTELHLVLTRLGEMCTVQDCVKMIASVDSDGDGNVNFDEFCTMMTKNKSMN